MTRYAAKKRKALALCARLSVLLVVLVTVAVAAWAFHAFAGLADWLISALPFGDSVEKAARSLPGGEAAQPLLLAMILAFFAGTLAFKVRHADARRFYERWLDSFNTDVFDPIRQPAAQLAGDQALPWLAPVAGHSAAARVQLWQALHDWVHQGADLRPDDGSARPFAWALLVGRPGAGKSRMADELARGLARRELLGSTARPGQGWRQRLRRWRLRAGAAWRLARQRSAPSDPWDAGRPAHRRGGRGSELLQASPSFRQAFEAWRPRAPTLIIFEDPRAEEAAELIRWLDAKTGPAAAGQPESPYRHPVRLLIVNQTLPADLGLVPDAQGWGSSLPGLTGGPWVVDEHNYLSWAEWCQLGHAHFKPDDKRRLAVQQADFNRLTSQGHPLLAEALLAWLAGHAEGVLPQITDEITPERLLDERAERVLRALQAAQVQQHGAWRLLAAASLVGGLRHEPASAAGAGTIDLAALQRVFPGEDVQQRIPPVRPDLIGQAFAELVVRTPPVAGVQPPATAEAQHHTAQAMADAAWRADPYAVLATLGKLLDRRAGSRRAGQSGPTRRGLLAALEQAATSGDPGTAQPELIARAFVRHHLAHGRSLAALRHWLQRVPPSTAQALASVDLFEFMALEPSAARDALAVFSLATDRALDDEAGAACPADDAVLGTLLDALQRLALLLAPRGVLPFGEHAPPTEGLQRLGACYAAWTLREPTAAWAAPAAIQQLFASLWDAPTVRDGLMLGFAKGCLSQATLGSELHAQARAAWAACADPGPDVDEYEQGMLDATNTTNLSLPNAESLALGLSRCASHHIRWWTIESAARVERCAAQIARVAEPFAGLPASERRQMAECLAEAWSTAAYAHSQTRTAEGAAQAERCATQIERVAQSFACLPASERRRLAEYSADAWVHAAFAHMKCRTAEGAAQTERCVAQIAQVAEPFASLPINERRTLATALARAWTYAASAYGQTRTSEGTAKAERCAAQIAWVAEPFAGLADGERRGLAECLTSAWESAAFSHVKAQTAGSAAKAESYAAQIAQVVKSFVNLPACERCSLAQNLAAALAYAAAAHSETRTSEGAAHAERCAAQTAQVGDSFVNLPARERLKLAQAVALAWSQVAVANSETRTAAGAARAERCAAQIARAAEPFTGLAVSERLELAGLLASTWSHAAFAHRSSSTAEGAARAERCAAHATAVAAPFIGLPSDEMVDLTKWQAAAWGYATAAHRISSPPADVQRCQEQVQAALAPLLAAGLPQPDWLDGVLKNAGLPGRQAPSFAVKPGLWHANLGR